MTIKKLQKNRGPVQLHFRKSGAGFVILFAVTISAILLAIALGVANIAFNEIKFGTSAVDTNNALFAADTGIEKALFDDKANNCDSLCSFSIGGLGSVGQSCVIVTFTITGTTTTVTSKGYNIGDANCAWSNPDRVSDRRKPSDRDN